MTSGVWEARYPDLAGKVTLVAGDLAGLVEIVATLAANHAPICVVAADRETVDSALAAAEASGAGAMGIAASPGDPATWLRVLPHAEQRLGPIDVIVATGSEAARDGVISAALPDMAARRRGVIVEVGQVASLATQNPGVRRRHIIVGAETLATDVAAAVALCASDVLAATAVAIELTT